MGDHAAHLEGWLLGLAGLKHYALRPELLNHGPGFAPASAGHVEANSAQYLTGHHAVPQFAGLLVWQHPIMPRSHQQIDGPTLSLPTLEQG